MSEIASFDTKLCNIYFNVTMYYLSTHKKTYCMYPDRQSPSKVSIKKVHPAEQVHQ